MPHSLEVLEVGLEELSDVASRRLPILSDLIVGLWQSTQGAWELLPRLDGNRPSLEVGPYSIAGPIDAQRVTHGPRVCTHKPVARNRLTREQKAQLICKRVEF